MCTIRNGAFLILLLGTLHTPGPLASQTEAEVGPRVRVFLDCQTQNCESTEFRSRIEYVDWVREREASDVHVIMTSQSAGPGTEYVLDLIGREMLAGTDLSLRFTSGVTNTQSEILHGLTRTLAAGLAAYAAQRGSAASLDIRQRDDARPLPAEDLSDEEILVQQRALATGFECELGVGLRYRFGSIYNNVVNNRFPWSVRAF